MSTNPQTTTAEVYTLMAVAAAFTVGLPVIIITQAWHAAGPFGAIMAALILANLAWVYTDRRKKKTTTRTQARPPRPRYPDSDNATITRARAATIGDARRKEHQA